MRIALAQINPTLGDFSSNAKKITEYLNKSEQRRCDLVVFPEASLFGYHPMDLLERAAIVDQQMKELESLSKQIPPSMAVLVGAIVPTKKKGGKPFYNAAVLLQKGKKMRVFAKTVLPTYDVFDEARHIEPGDVSKNVFSFKKQKILVTICEDIWAWPDKAQAGHPTYPENPLKRLKASDVDLVVNLSASPFTDSKREHRERVTQNVVRHFKAPLVYVNMVGAQDELIFDGASFALSAKGQRMAQSIGFEEDLNVVDYATSKGGERELPDDLSELRRQAISLGLRDFTQKLGMEKVHLGLSGGIDSALVACLAVDALGPFNVTAIALPGPFNAPESLKWARQLADNLGIKFLNLPIDSLYENSKNVIHETMGKMPFGLLHENLQARLRGILLMAYSNKEGSILLNTSNKSEMAMGYSTLYGDSIGGMCPIGDLLKTEVYELARHYNHQSEIIPQEIIDRPPSAELRPDQKDADSLPPYEKLDRVINKLVKDLKAPRGALEKRVLSEMMKSEFKRWQAPPILKVSDHAFGRGRRLPVAHRAIF